MTKYEQLAVFSQDKASFLKLLADWNVQNPDKKLNKAKFFEFMLGEFRKRLKSGEIK